MERVEIAGHFCLHFDLIFTDVKRDNVEFAVFFSSLKIKKKTFGTMTRTFKMLILQKFNADFPKNALIFFTSTNRKPWVQSGNRGCRGASQDSGSGDHRFESRPLRDSLCDFS